MYDKHPVVNRGQMAGDTRATHSTTGQRAGMSEQTLQDVARRAGVSTMTVSRVLRRSGYVSANTRKKVLRALALTGYIPNQIAGSLSQQHTNLVGVLLPSMTNYVYPEVLAGIAKGLEGASLQPVFGITDYQASIEEALIRDMISWRPSGMAIAGLHHTPAARDMLRATSIPIAEMMETDGRVIEYAVGLSHRRAAELIAEHLLARGYRSIAYIAHDHKRDITARKRHKAFVQALRRAGCELTCSAIGTEPSSPLLGRRLTAAILTDNTAIDAIYYSNDDMAVGGLMHCLATGVTVPDSVALCGFSGFSRNQGLPLELTTVISPRFEIGRLAARYIVERLDGTRPARPVRRVLPIEFVPGQTS